MFSKSLTEIPHSKVPECAQQQSDSARTYILYHNPLLTGIQNLYRKFTHDDVLVDGIHYVELE